jgi:hypothetical protein
VERAVISAYSQRLNKATGRVDDEYLFSVDIDHERFSNIDFTNLSRVDPVEALAAFPIRRKMSKGGTFKGTVHAGQAQRDWIGALRRTGIGGAWADLTPTTVAFVTSAGPRR